MCTRSKPNKNSCNQHHNLDHIPYETNHSLAASLTSPTFNLGVYFFSTFSLWYFIITISLILIHQCHRIASHRNLHPANAVAAIKRRRNPKPGTKKKKGEGETYLPELLRCILARNTLENLRATGVLVDEIRDVEDVAVDDDVQALVGGVVRGDVGGGEGLGHFAFFLSFLVGYWDC